MSPSHSARSVLALIVILAWALPAAAEEPAALAARIQARYRQIDTLTADYQRHSRFKALGEESGREVSGSGRLYWARPLNLRLEQETPRGELVVTSGREAWWVRPEREKADLYPMDNFTAGLKPILDALGGLARLDQDFTVRAPAAGEGGAPEGMPALALVPKDRRADLSLLVVWFDPGELVLKGFTIINLVGDDTTYRFGEVRVNQPLNEAMFSFTPPAGYRVRDHRPLKPPAGESNG